MRRRDLLGGSVALLALGAAWWSTAGPLGGSQRPEDEVEPVSVETLQTAHSSSGTMTVPVPGTVTVIDVFATWCQACDEQLQNLATAHDSVGDRAAFVSVTNQAMGGGLTRDDVREFWADHAGRWPVALDDEGALTTRIGVEGLPYTVVTDVSGRIVYARQGTTPPADVITAVERASGER